jgi:antitoxin (DNA-binding transcriptional repressor) of toxin-antitoxin stability system
MKTIDLSEVTALAPHVQAGSQEPIVLTENGRTVAAILPSDEQGVESMLLSLSPQFKVILDRSQQRLDAEGGLSAADVRARLGIRAKQSDP